MTVSEYVTIYPPFLVSRIENYPYVPPREQREAILDDFDIFYGNGIVDSALNMSAPFENNIEWHEYQAAKSVATNFDQPIC